MSQPFSFTTTYQLDKPHYTECFEESAGSSTSLSLYFKAIILAFFGFYFVINTTVEPYIAWFIVALGAVDGLSVYYRKAWWVGRQMLSKTAGAELTLTIDDVGIKSHTNIMTNEILWPEIISLDKTEKGWLVIHNSGKSYISSSCLSPLAETFLLQQSSNLAESKE